ncbi:MAG: DUF928 domain-containing protein [Leptolyngbyaceae cyanobacterium]
MKSFSWMVNDLLDGVDRNSLAFPIFLALVALTAAFSIAQKTLAQSPPPSPPFSDVGQPSDSKPAGSRGEGCDIADDTVNREMIALLPVDNRGGWTTVGTPNIWIYLPFSLRSDYDARLFVETFQMGEDGTMVAEAMTRQRLQMQDTQPGIHFFPVALTDGPVPADLAPAESPDQLIPSTVYRWTLKISCDEIGNEPMELSGNIRRVDVDVSAHPDWSSDNPTSFSTAYADNQVWYDALTVLGWLRLAEPENTDYIEAWQQLLSYPTVGLEAIANEPLINCCTPETE